MAGVSSKRIMIMNLIGYKNSFATVITASIFYLMTFSSCKTASDTSQPSTGNAPQTTGTISHVGTFTGMRPCADCQQLIVRLTLNRDLTYNESLTYMGKSSTPLESQGKYEVLKNGDIKLDKSTPGMQYFRPNNDGLLMLDTEGKIITGATAHLYQMRKEERREQPEKPAQRNEMKWVQGIGFYALGNEPGWSLDMNFTSGFTLRLQNGQVIQTPPVKSSKTMDAPTERFASKNSQGEMIVTITMQKCSDVMSGEMFPYQVDVTWQPVGAEIKKLRGCGRFTVDPALSARWILQNIEGVKPDATDLPKGMPGIEIDAERGRFSGHGGCNLFSGTFTPGSEGRLYTSAFAATKMACKNMTLENEFLKSLSETTLEYKLAGDTLLLKSLSGKALAFKKTR